MFSIPPPPKKEIKLINATGSYIAWNADQENSCGINMTMDEDTHYYVIMSYPSSASYFTTTKTASGTLMNELPSFVSLPNPPWTNAYCAYEGDVKAGGKITASIQSKTTNSDSSFWIIVFSEK